MTKSINVRIDDELYTAMNSHEEINWSGVVRLALKEKLGEVKVRKFDQEKARKAFKDSQRLLESKAFTGRSGVDIIREWRDKKK